MASNDELPDIPDLPQEDPGGGKRQRARSGMSEDERRARNSARKAAKRANQTSEERQAVRASDRLQKA